MANDQTAGSTAGALFNAVGRALLVGSIAGILLAAFRALAELPMNALSYPASSVAGVIVVLLLELGATILVAKSPSSRSAACALMSMVLACTWLLARNVEPFNTALMVLLGSSLGALAVDFVARRWRGAPGTMHFLWVAAGAYLGSGLWLPHPELSWLRSYGLDALTAIPAGTLICLGLPARR